jgi:hypothetical protein
MGLRCDVSAGKAGISGKGKGEAPRGHFPGGEEGCRGAVDIFHEIRRENNWIILPFSKGVALDYNQIVESIHLLIESNYARA